jgi:hypothetical protein
MIIALYVIGCIVSYFFGRWQWRKRHYGQWTQGDRLFMILCSLASWANVLAAIIIIGLASLDGLDSKKASW